MDNQELRDQIMTLLFSGHETTALALSWTWYLLSEHPAVERTLHAELAEVLQGRMPTVDDLPKLQYTRMVVEEALRLYPPAWVLTRRAMSDDVVGGYRVPRNAVVIFSPYALHRHPSLWRDPERYDPERFSARSSSERSRFAYLPFGAGPRMCIGSGFAMTEARLILATIAQRYCLRLRVGHPVEPKPLISLHPRFGLPMALIQRSRET